MRKKSQWIAGLELGSRQFTAAVGEMPPQGRLLVKMVKSVPAQGMEGGVVSDPIECSDAVARLMRQVEQALSERLTLVLTSFDSPNLKSANASSSIPISDPTIGISYRDVEKVMNVCRTLSLDYDRAILHAFERGFTVDGQTGIKNPVGLYGTKLSVELNLVTSQNTTVSNVTRVLNRAGLEVEDFVLPALADAEAVLSDLDQDLGVTLVRIGEYQSEIIVFADGMVRETFLIPWGVERLIESLARSLKLPKAAAEQLLTQIQGLEEAPEWAQIPLQIKAGSLDRSFPRGQVVHLVASRAREFLTRVERQLQASPYFRESAAGIIMVGHLARLEGFLELAESVLNMPVRMGNPREIELDPDISYIDSHLTPIGLIRYGFKSRLDSGETRPWPTTLWMRWMEKGRRVLEEYF